MTRLSILLAVLALPAVASADIVPDGYVEHCTLDEVGRQRSGCVACGTSFEAPTACEQAHASDGLERACRSGGASVWTEIWCRPAGAPPPSSAAPASVAPPSVAPPSSVAAAEESHSGCAASHTRGSFGGVLALVAMAWLWKRARRT